MKMVGAVGMEENKKNQCNKNITETFLGRFLGFSVIGSAILLVALDYSVATVAPGSGKDKDLRHDSSLSVEVALLA